jgi:hypothetical protein
MPLLQSGCARRLFPKRWSLGAPRTMSFLPGPCRPCPLRHAGTAQLVNRPWAAANFRPGSVSSSVGGALRLDSGQAAPLVL